MAKNNNLAVIVHLLSLLTGLIGLLIMYLLVKDDYIKNHIKKAFNWKVSYIIYQFISIALMFFLIGFFSFIVFIILNFVFCITAMIKASNGKIWNYPLTIPLFK